MIALLEEELKKKNNHNSNDHNDNENNNNNSLTTMQMIVYLKKSLIKPVKLWTFVTFSSLSNLLCSTSTLAKMLKLYIFRIL